VYAALAATMRPARDYNGVMASKRFADQLARLTTGPGVYLMKNVDGEVVYVGKAANLRNRVRSYFGSPLSMEGKTRALSESIADFDVVLTRTEQEALHLEAELVKRHQPFFNIRLKDDKHYPYLKVDLADPWPRVYITRRIERDGARYFGPYANAGSVRRTLDIVNKLFPWRSCTKTITGADARPCLDYYINRCIAPCTGYCSPEEYAEVIRQVILFLEGRTDEVVRGLQAQMDDASERMDYERAARLRDQLRAIERVTERQAVASTRPSEADVFGLARGDDDAAVQALFVRGVKMTGTDSFMLDGTRGETDADVMASFLKQFYESATRVPRRVVVPIELPEQALIESWLSERRGGTVRIVVPQRGERRRLVEMAKAGFIVIVGFALARILSNNLGRAVQKYSNAQRGFLARRVAYYAIVVLAVVSALRELGFEFTVLLGAAGVLTVAVGFASQTSASNLISGLFLMAEEAFAVGDVVRVGGKIGRAHV